MTFDFADTVQNPFYHLCSDGALTPRLIESEDDFRSAFNLIGVCAANSRIRILSYSIEETHLHLLVCSTYPSCKLFKSMFEESWDHHVARKRGTLKGADIEIEIIPVDSRDYLMNVGTYTIIQPTKDGKGVLPYDYRWGTGSMYFRPEGHVPIWCRNEDGSIADTVAVESLSTRAVRRILCSRRQVPGGWRLCQGLLLPDNYVDTGLYEQIYQTANCFRVYMASNRSREQAVRERIAAFRGVSLDDAEAHQVFSDLMLRLYGFKDVRRLNAEQRIGVAQQLRKIHRLALRQIAALVRLPYQEVCKYV